MKMSRGLLGWGTLFLVLAGLSHAQDVDNSKQTRKSGQESSSTVTRKIMDQIMTAIIQVIPDSFDIEKFSRQDVRARTLQNLKKLSEHSGVLIQHGAQRDKAFAFLADSLSRDVRDLQRRYEKGNYEEAQYLLHQTIENCTSCHSKLPEGVPAPNLTAFFKSVDSSSLSVLERAQLQTALRQFDDALKSYEEYFVKTTKTTDLLRTDSMVEYLKIILRVKRDPKRALSMLTQLSKRQDLPKFLSLELKSWIESLEKISKLGEVRTNQLSSAARMIQDAQAKMEFPMDRSFVVDFIYASSLLNQFLSVPLRPKEQEAEAYYWLGITETLIGRSFWVSQTENYLEWCIRLAPKTAFARKAYRILEQHVVFQYTGSGGTDIPEDMTKNLSELRRLVFE